MEKSIIRALISRTVARPRRERQRNRKVERQNTSIRKEKSISKILVLDTFFFSSLNIQDTTGEPTYNLGRRLLIQSRPVWRRKRGRRRGQRYSNPTMDPYQSEAFTLKLHDLSFSLVQFSLLEFDKPQSSRARSELRSQGTLSRIATPAAILLFSMMSRETPAIGISHRGIKCVLERGGQRVARRHSREASERSQGHVRPRKREGSTGVPAFPWKTHRTKIRPTYDWDDFEIDRSSSKTRN